MSLVNGQIKFSVPACLRLLPLSFRPVVTFAPITPDGTLIWPSSASEPRRTGAGYFTILYNGLPAELNELSVTCFKRAIAKR